MIQKKKNWVFEKWMWKQGNGGGGGWEFETISSSCATYYANSVQLQGQKSGGGWMVAQVVSCALMNGR